MLKGLPTTTIADEHDADHDFLSCIREIDFDRASTSRERALGRQSNDLWRQPENSLSDESDVKILKRIGNITNTDESRLFDVRERGPPSYSYTPKCTSPTTFAFQPKRLVVFTLILLREWNCENDIVAYFRPSLRNTSGADGDFATRLLSGTE